MLRRLCERFVKSCEARGLARNTINHYQSDILKFNAYLCEKEFDSVEQITPEVVEDYLAEKRALVAKSTLRTYYMSIRTFFGFLHKRGFIITNPFAYVVKPKQGKHATRRFNEVEIDKILGACDKSTFTGLRNYATFCLMLATGLRFSCHTIRHTFATNVLKNGGDIVSLQKVLGHSRIETTKLYINLSRNDIVEQMQKFNPLDNQSCYKL